MYYCIDIVKTFQKMYTFGLGGQISIFPPKMNDQLPNMINLEPLNIACVLPKIKRKCHSWVPSQHFYRNYTLYFHIITENTEGKGIAFGGPFY